MSAKEFAHALKPGFKSAAAAVAVVYPKKVRRLLGILQFLSFRAVFDNGC
jgi:hypothetical protein